jgi:hypothetical protein
MKNYSYHHDNGNVLNRTSIDIDLFNTNLSVLVEFGHLGNILWGYIWVAGRFSNRHKRYIREKDSKLNKQVMDKPLIQMSLLVLY